MKLNEIANQVELAKSIVLRYTDEFVEDPKLGAAVQQLLKQFSYTGVLYRTVYIEDEDALEGIDHISEVVNSYQSASGISAWSKDLKGMQAAVDHEINSDNIETNAGIVLVMHGTGLDINALDPERQPFLAQENEVLAVMSNAKIYGFVAGVGSIFPVDKYEEFTEALSELMDEDGDPDFE